MNQINFKGFELFWYLIKLYYYILNCRIILSFFNRIFRGLTPPYLAEIINRSIKFFKRDQLFDGDDSLFKKLCKETQIYGEYGCGQSTVWVSKNTNNLILSVDTSNFWAKKVKAFVSDNDRLKIEFINCGETFSYGYPTTYKKREKFKNYCNSIWDHAELYPEIVLIDGRFRISCFLTCLIRGQVGTKLIFDDYVNSPNYHVVEEYIKPLKFCGRQALFIISDMDKQSFDKNKLLQEISNFQYVLD